MKPVFKALDEDKLGLWQSIVYAAERKGIKVKGNKVLFLALLEMDKEALIELETLIVDLVYVDDDYEV